MKQEEIDDALAEIERIHKAEKATIEALGALPDKNSQYRVLRALCVLLDCPEHFGDRPNRLFPAEARKRYSRVKSGEVA